MGSDDIRTVLIKNKVFWQCAAISIGKYTSTFGKIIS